MNGIVRLDEAERRLPDDTDDVRILPRNLEAEAAVLGTALLRNDALDEVASVVQSSSFFRHANSLIFRGMLALRQRGIPIDLVSLKEELSRTGDLDRVNGPAYIASLTDGIPTTTNVRHYAGIVLEKARRREAIQLANTISARAHDPAHQLAGLGNLVQNLSDSVSGSSTDEPTISEPLPALLERVAGAELPSFLVEDLIPGDGIVLLHSQPREFKSMVALSLTLAVTTGTPAFGLKRLRVPKRVPAWYITEEDGERRVAARLEQLARGLNVGRVPEHLHVSAGRGISLDNADCQSRLIATVRRHEFRLVVLDPLRSLTEAADQGPRELKPLAMFLRTFIRETGAVVLIVHHDTKPAAHARDTRRRPQRASGGGIFSIADSPIHVERVDAANRVLVPSDYKFQADPPPVRIALEHDADCLRLVGNDLAPAGPTSPNLDDRVMRFLLKRPNSSSSDVVRGVRAGKQAVLEQLKVLEGQGLVGVVTEGKAKLWRALCTEQDVGSSGSPPVPEPMNR